MAMLPRAAMTGFGLICSLLLLSLPLTLARTADSNLDNRNPYCFMYFGNMSAVVHVPDALPDINYNGNKCPRTWNIDLPNPSTLRLCPPANTPTTSLENLAVDVALRVYEVNKDIWNLNPISLQIYDILVSNGSVPGPYVNGVIKPAILAPNKEPSDGLPAWTIKGTEEALFEDKKDTQYSGPNRYVELACAKVSNNDSDHYCASRQEGHTGEGCWRDSRIYWTTDAQNLNYTFQFDNSSAAVTLSTKAEHIYLRNNTHTGTYLTAEIRFQGHHILPAKDSKFWSNYSGDYQSEKEHYHDGIIRLVPDETGMPLLLNSTSGEWYAARNGTFLKNGGAAMYSGGTTTLALTGTLAVLLWTFLA
ncbi:uncharacterized protein GIQ15_04506 [Arthroderma uncinatum]|uniref:uncharacterized protein n=1 Tax=Arthroderma uncinatum TaxID=74035 RepID=UPI00144ADA2D|nr:uncharacterized protein GIQ15_04506 [Arthroderma uncinatum]KAF3481747.1 hypothetical protein GIQ15_04506 [Arthroderma uncinatum]